MSNEVQTPESPLLADLCAQLAGLAAETDIHNTWPEAQLRLCGEYGVYRWFLSREVGGLGWSAADIVRGYLRLSSACLSTTFIITQRTGACNRIACGQSNHARDALLPELLTGESFATVGISHLTTSRRHLAKPVLTAVETADGFLLDGYSPWVTGGDHAETIVIGATLKDDRQILVALPGDATGVSADPPQQLVALTSSHTCAVRCNNVHVDRQWLLAGPAHDVMTSSGGTGAATGGLQTSTLAVGLADAAITFMEGETAQRGDLQEPTNELRRDQQQLQTDLLELAAGEHPCSLETLRIRANSLVLRATQAALTTAKGAGYVSGHPTGRWCREALFFLVWSCPQPVVQASLCELAGLSD
ncbi:MAG: acyl-CoA/acyl-ACP dehydrogenase [Pirellulales bacterium]|nr:acyl-CoA/acyl-ACP dehydrogenase [Pirellulales bacterium]